MRRLFKFVVFLAVVGVIVITILDRAYSPNGKPVIVLGDSITALATPQLNKSLGSEVKLTVNGHYGDTVDEREQAANLLATENPSQVIINLGTNDALQHLPATQSVLGLTEMVREFRSATCVHLVTINTHLDQLGNRPHAEADVLNRAIRKLATTYKNVDVIDWDSINARAITSLTPNGLTYDGVHPTADGFRQLASAYVDAVNRCQRPWHIW